MNAAPRPLVQNAVSPQVETTATPNVQPMNKPLLRFQGRAEAVGTDFFCQVYHGDGNDRRIVSQNDRAFSILDGFPVNPGHLLVVPKRHFASLFSATEAEVTDIFRLIFQWKQRISKIYANNPKLPKLTGFNVGVNVGEGGGQTVDHLHVHIIPRCEGDMKDTSGGLRAWINNRVVSPWLGANTPTGGIRGIIPHEQKYGGDPDPTVSWIFEGES